MDAATRCVLLNKIVSDEKYDRSYYTHTDTHTHIAHGEEIQRSGNAIPKICNFDFGAFCARIVRAKRLCFVLAPLRSAIASVLNSFDVNFTDKREEDASYLNL